MSVIKWLQQFKTFASKKRKQTTNFAKKKTPRELAIETALYIEQRFKNWVTAEIVFDKFKKEFGSVQYTEQLMQTLVYHKVAVVKQEPNQRPKYKISSSAKLRSYILDEVIKEYEVVLANLKEERKQYE